MADSRTKRTRHDAFTQKKQELFLRAYAQTGNVLASCRAAGAGRRTVYEHKDSNPDFARKWAEAEEDAVDLLEAKARNLAMEGKETSLWNLLKAHRPKKYNPPQKFAQTDAEGNDVQITEVRVHLNDGSNSTPNM